MWGLSPILRAWRQSALQGNGMASGRSYVDDVGSAGRAATKPRLEVGKGVGSLPATSGYVGGRAARLTNSRSFARRLGGTHADVRGKQWFALKVRCSTS